MTLRGSYETGKSTDRNITSLQPTVSSEQCFSSGLSEGVGKSSAALFAVHLPNSTCLYRSVCV